MAKLTRITGKTFGETASPTGDESVGAYIGQFGSAKAGTYVGTSDIGTIQALPAWSNGFIDAVTPSNQYPPLPEMTGALKVLSYQENYILQQGMPEWDAGTTYYTNNFCSFDGIIYQSLEDDNLNNQPDVSFTSWTVYGAVSDYANQGLSNLTTFGNSRLQLVPFSINAGTVSGGENNTLTYSGSVITCAPCTITTVDGRTKVFESSATLDVSNQSTGTYAVFKNYADGSLVIHNGFSISKTAPSTSYYWLDISTIPANLKIYDSSWENNNDLVYIGIVKISSGSISKLSNREFNDSGFLVQKYVFQAPHYNSGITTTIPNNSSTSYTCPSDGIVNACTNVSGQNSGTVSISINGIVVAATKYQGQYSNDGISATIIVKKNDVVAANQSGANYDSGNSFIKFFPIGGVN